MAAAVCMRLPAPCPSATKCRGNRGPPGLTVGLALIGTTTPRGHSGLPRAGGASARSELENASLKKGRWLPEGPRRVPWAAEGPGEGWQGQQVCALCACVRVCVCGFTPSLTAVASAREKTAQRSRLRVFLEGSPLLRHQRSSCGKHFNQNIRSKFNFKL